MIDLRTQIAILIAVTIGRLGHPPTNHQRLLLRQKVRSHLFDQHLWPTKETMRQVDQFIDEACTQMNRWNLEATDQEE
jgi:hypothetical protein